MHACIFIESEARHGDRIRELYHYAWSRCTHPRCSLQEAQQRYVDEFVYLFCAIASIQAD